MGNQLRALGALSLTLALLLLTNCSTFSRQETRRPTSVSKAPLMWPVAKPKISQHFKSEATGDPHDGIDLSAPKGTRIYAPNDGRVVYAGHKFRGYGKMIIIEHTPILATIYGHCQKLLVKSGEWVRKGSLIGLVGKTGRATAPHLHFEVRLKQKPRNPLEFLR